LAVLLRKYDHQPSPSEVPEHPESVALRPQPFAPEPGSVVDITTHRSSLGTRIDSGEEMELMDTPQTVDEYISRFPPEVQEVLASVRATVLASAPEAEERISYKMPAVFQHGAVVYYAAFKKHIGLYPPVRDPRVGALVARFAGPKGNLQFPLAEPLPLELIARVVRANLGANLARAASKQRGQKAAFSSSARGPSRNKGDA
jgi:uncharacterized protein YdhG (YjbR/CyaY superfamily)